MIANYKMHRPPMKTAVALPGLVDPHDLSTDRQFSMNLARGLEVLRAFTPLEPTLGNREISDRTGLPKPTVSRLTYTLMLMGYLSRDARLQKFRLGPGVLSLAHPLLASMPVRQLARPLLEALARKTGCTVNLGMRDRANVVYVDSVHADSSNQHHPEIGSSRPLLPCAIGRALILGRPSQERTAILNYLKVQNGEQFEQYRAIWERDARLFAEHGFCQAQGEWKRDLHAVAVPVWTPPHETPVSINCSIVAYRLPPEKLQREVVPLLLDTARQLASAQGYT